MCWNLAPAQQRLPLAGAFSVPDQKACALDRDLAAPARMLGEAERQKSRATVEHLPLRLERCSRRARCSRRRARTRRALEQRPADPLYLCQSSATQRGANSAVRSRRRSARSAPTAMNRRRCWIERDQRQLAVVVELGDERRKHPRRQRRRVLHEALVARALRAPWKKRASESASSGRIGRTGRRTPPAVSVYPAFELEPGKGVNRHVRVMGRRRAATLRITDDAGVGDHRAAGVGASTQGRDPSLFQPGAAGTPCARRRTAGRRGRSKPTAGTSAIGRRARAVRGYARDQLARAPWTMLQRQGRLCRQPGSPICSSIAAMPQPVPKLK